MHDQIKGTVLDQSLTKSCCSIADEDSRPEDHGWVVHYLWRLQHGKGQQKKTKAAGRNIIQSGDGVQLQTPALQKDLNQNQASGFCAN